MRTVLIVNAERHSENAGLRFRVHADRLKDHFRIDFEELQTWLSPISREEDLSGWAGSSDEEKGGARGLAGFLQNTKEVDNPIVARADHAVAVCAVY